ncbi:prephenate dehydratase [Bacillus alkalicellulosilyticus]|uniref:prephenate dehydratase n=1 Tax=Alkalihalobacterium alkalicellulosilyticum TaxID=1912214 RepID=UPI0009978E4C|nr:prephenate dehydratase [Bacillus alkalicellulosilyticus]
MKKIGYLGPKGTFTEMAVNAIFASKQAIPYSTIPNCMDAVSAKEVDIAVVPLENAIEGSVNLTLDYIIHKHEIPIVGEVVVPIEQHLLVHPENSANWSGVEVVYSHPHAIAQCHDFLRKVLPKAELKYMNSTGAAAQHVLNHPSEKAAAIANELAASVYQLDTAERCIHDYENNLTRFVILSNDKEEISSPLYFEDKTTMMVTLPADYSGALHQVLSAFAWRKLNLTKIESRPMKTGLGNYLFVIDVDQRMDEVLIPGVIAELEALGCGVRVLGSYPCFTLKKTKDVDKKPVPK